MANPSPKSEEAEKETLVEEGEEEYGSDDDSEYSDDSDDEYEDEEDEGMTQEEREELEQQREEKREDKRRKREEEEAKRKAEEEVVEEEDLWDFPVDREHWTEEDLGEHWEDYWGDTNAVGWDPELVSSASYEKYEKLWNEGNPGPPGTPYYVPYRKFYPQIPDNHYDIQTPEDVVEELERMEEFLVWVSYIFKDGSTYEGTVWDDLAHGKGVYTTAMELCRYEGEWFQNMMQGHGVLEVDLPVAEPVPDSEEAVQAKKKGEILRSDYMNSFDREWLKMDAEELFEKHANTFTSFEERQSWIDEYGETPEKGHYKYAGQWKHSRFHGCGVYEVNGRPIWGKFYFGELLPDPEECTVEMSGLHSSLAEVAAAKARMFVNKPDGMVREVKGPYSDPSHPYMYEEEDLWMAPGFINAYYEVPKEWKLYVEDLDNEREMWLNSFVKAPFVTPMPPELEYWWSQEDEFVLLGNTPSVMLDLNPENVERAREELQGEVILHVPTGRIINWAHDDEGQLRFFYQPITEDGEVKPEAAIPLPLGFDDHLKDVTDISAKAGSKKKNFFQRVKEAWVKTSEEYQQDREKRKQELENQWKQDDQIAELRQKSRRAERNLAFQIEEEKLLASYREKDSKTAVNEEAADQEQSDEASQGKPEEDDEAGSLGLAAQENKEDAEKTAEEPKEDEQDDDDDKKPRSFGKVAMVGVGGEAGLWDSKHKPKEQGSIFPTAFASLSLGPKMVVDEVLRSRFGQVMVDLLPKFRYRPCHMKNDPISQGRKISFQHVKCPYIPEHLRLTASCASRKPAAKGVHRVACRTRRQVHSYNKPGGIKCRRYVNNMASCHQCSPSGIWSKPEFGFLSMAVPIEQ